MIVGVAALATSCKEDDPSYVYPTDGIQINYPANVKSKANEQLVFTNRSTGDKLSVALGGAVELINGLYDCNYTADITYLNDTVVVDGELYGVKSSIEVKGKPEFAIDTYIFASKNDFVIEEIFLTGTNTPAKKAYSYDKYVKIYNNTDSVLYADGIALLESKFLSTQKYDYKPDIRNQSMAVQAVYVVPGNGTDHPVKPGESFIICDQARNHVESNEWSFDLSHANVEWYDESTSAANQDIDNPDVPNMDKWYCYTKSLWIMQNQSTRSYAIARMKVDMNTYVEGYAYDYTYTIVANDVQKEMSQSCYSVPNDWIIDGVNCSLADVRQWNILPADIDAGFTSCGERTADPNRFFKSMRRKVLFVTEDGRKVLQDTNNSSNDFNANSVPSVIEEQGSVCDNDGNHATVKTYDGVKPIAE